MSVDADSSSASSSESPRSGSAGRKTFPEGTKATAAVVKTEVSLTPAKKDGAGAAATAEAATKEVVVGEEAGGAPGATAAPAAPPAVRTGIDQEMGELSELFAPDAFLQSTVLDTEMEAAGSGAARVAASEMDMVIEPTATPDGAKTAPAAAASAPAPPAVKAEYPPSSASAAAASSPLAATSATPAAPAPAPVAPKPECRCGEAACPSLARKRPMPELSSSSSSTAVESGTGGDGGGAPLSLMTGMPYTGLSSRQRKRQRSLAPVLSAPRTVSYECALCKESYPSEISSNPWWSLFLHECPRCHRMQIPRVDAASAAVSVDYIHAVCAEEGEGCDSDG